MDNLKNSKFNSFGVAEEIDNLKTKISKSKLFIYLSVLSLFFVFIGVRSANNTMSGLLTLLLSATCAFIAYSTTVVIKPGLLSLLVPAVSLVAVLLGTKDVATIIMTLAFIPSGFALGLSVKTKKSRMHSVLISGFITATFIFFVLGYQLYLYKGAITYDSFHETVIEIATAYVRSYLLPMANFDEVFETLSPVDVASDAIKSFLAAFVLIISFVQAYFGGFTIKNILKRVGIEGEYFEHDKKWELHVSKVAAIVFIITSIMFSVFQKFDNIGLIASVITVMYPIGAGLALIGFKSLFTFLKKGKLLTYVIFMLILFGVSIFALFVVLLIFIGLLKTLIRGTKIDFFQKTEQ